MRFETTAHKAAMRRLFLLLIALLTAIVLASCGGGAGDDSASQTVTQPPAPTTERPDNVWLDLLSRVPADQDATYGIVMGDFARFREALGIAQPSHDAPGQEIFDYIGSMSLLRDEAGNFIQPGIHTPELFVRAQFNAALEAMRTRWGFTIADLDQSLSVLSNERSLQILRGRFDGAAIGESLRSDAAFADALQVDEQQGVTFYSWSGVPPVDPVGEEQLDEAERRGRALAIDQDTIYYDRSDHVAQVVGTASRQGTSLADVDGIRLLAEGLGHYELYAAGLGVNAMNVSRAAGIACGINCPDDTLTAIEAEMRAQGVLLPFGVFATGVGKIEGGYSFVLIASHADETTAQTNAGLLRQRIERGATSERGEKWSDALQDLEISTEGPLLYLTARVEKPSLWSSLIFVGNSLLVQQD